MERSSLLSSAQFLANLAVRSLFGRQVLEFIEHVPPALSKAALSRIELDKSKLGVKMVRLSRPAERELLARTARDSLDKQ